jgi:Mn-containing catalase
VSTKTCIVFPNNNPWVSKYLKSLLARKKTVHAVGDRQALRDIQCEIKRQILVDKEAYKQRVERTLSRNPRADWQGIKSMASTPHIGSGKKQCRSWGI